jgi:hypothetical protein
VNDCEFPASLATVARSVHILPLSRLISIRNCAASPA